MKIDQASLCKVIIWLTGLSKRPVIAKQHKPKSNCATSTHRDGVYDQISSILASLAKGTQEKSSKHRNATTVGLGH